MNYADQLKQLIVALNQKHVDYIVIGGAALNIHGLIRATQDVDLFIAPNEENISRLKDALHELWNDPCIDEITADDLCGDYPVIRYGPPEGELFLDLLSRLGERVTYDDLSSETIDLDGIPVNVATPQTLFDMKKDTLRPIDKADALALWETFNLQDNNSAD